MAMTVSVPVCTTLMVSVKNRRHLSLSERVYDQQLQYVTPVVDPGHRYA